MLPYKKQSIKIEKSSKSCLKFAQIIQKFPEIQKLKSKNTPKKISIRIIDQLFF